MSNPKYSVNAGDNIFKIAENSLDNGLGNVIILGDNGEYIGYCDLKTVRDIIKSGKYLSNIFAKDIAKSGPLMKKGAIAPDGFNLVAIVDDNNIVIDYLVRQNLDFIPVSEPNLSHVEFRNLMDAFLSTWISSTGEYIRQFERDFADKCGMKHGVATSNGTVSLHLAMLALGIGPGDEVIVPDLTFAASINAVLYCGATPVIVDVDRDTWCMSVETFQNAITPKTKAVMPVHVFGRPAPMGPIAELAREKGIYIIEDCAEAHGAEYDGIKVGAYSDVASFSFFANKILTTGEGGLCLTNSDDLAARMKVLRDHGMRPERRYWHEEVGYNYRMTNLQASVGVAQVERFEELLNTRQEINDAYKAALSGIKGVTWPAQMDNRSKPVAWFACALVPPEKRAQLIDECKKSNIDLRPFFNCLTIMPAYKNWANNCPNSEYLSQAGVNLPTSHRIDSAVIAEIATIFARVLN